MRFHWTEKRRFILCTKVFILLGNMSDNFFYHEKASHILQNFTTTIAHIQKIYGSFLFNHNIIDENGWLQKDRKILVEVTRTWGTNQLKTHSRSCGYYTIVELTLNILDKTWMLALYYFADIKNILSK